MKELKLRYYPDPILRQTATPVDSFDDDLAELAEAMIDTMYREKGIGLAAPQVGIGIRLIVALQLRSPEDSEGPPLALVNPRVVATGGELWSLEEGCLSIPGVNAAVLRPTHVEVAYQDLSGAEKTVASDGMFGRILLHEIDHLNGKLFIDYLSTAQKSLVKSKLKALTEDTPD